MFQACGVHGASVVTALTAQNTRGVQRVLHVAPRFVGAQIDSVMSDLPVAAAKTGMLDRAQVVAVVCERVRRRKIPNLVVDPVLLAKDGTPLLNRRGLELVRRELLPLALLVTPNVPEAEVLSGTTIADVESLREAARRINGLGVPAVLIKGGHLPGEPVDTLLWQGEFHEFSGQRVGNGDLAPVHGTGCFLSAALAARIARGDSVIEACAAAKAMIARAIAMAWAPGKGTRLAVPLPLGEGEGG